MYRIQAPATAPLAAPIPWRKQGIRHSNNEIYFDMAESMDAIVDR
jgi:AP-3 complex subunit mu